MGLPTLKISANACEWPSFGRNSMAINAEFERPVNVEAAKAAIAAFSGAELVMIRRKQAYPTPLDFSRKVKCGVGISMHPASIPRGAENGLALWGDRRQPLERSRP